MLIKGDARHIPLKNKSVQMICTSPPYWGLRDYGTARWEGGDAECNHKQGRTGAANAHGYEVKPSPRNRDGVSALTSGVCSNCGVQRVDAQIGLERTPEEYVASILAVMREVWRVLRDDGTLWLNLGDSYARNGGEPGGGNRELLHMEGKQRRMKAVPDGSGLKAKDLVGIPWRVAFALQADGWYLRSDIVWSKLNPMPESVTDRPTKTHEYIFLLSKSERYFWDQEAVKEQAAYAGPNAPDKIKSPYGQGFTRNASWRGSKFEDGKNIENHPNVGRKRGGDFSRKYAEQQPHHGAMTLERPEDNGKRNIRSVWTIATQPYSGAHFATFPREIPERCIKAGTSEKGCCPKCGAAWQRIVEKQRPPEQCYTKCRLPISDELINSGVRRDGIRRGSGQKVQNWREEHPDQTTGWQPTCSCNAGDPVPCVVLDPFCGSGTTVMVAQDLGRIGIGLDLTYQALAAERIGGPLFASVVNSAFN